MGFLGNLALKAARAMGAVDAQDPQRQMRRQTGGFIQLGGAVGYWDQINAEKALSHPIVYRCLNKIGTAVQSVNWYVEKEGSTKDGRRKYTTDVERSIQSALDAPCGEWSASRLRYWMAMNLACFGNIYGKIGVSVKGTPQAIYPLDAHKVKPRYDGGGGLAGYTIDGSGGLFLPSRAKVEGTSDAGKGWAFRIASGGLDADPTKDKINSPLLAIGLPAQIAELLFQRAIDTASGSPNLRFALYTDGTSTEEMEQQLSSMLQRAKPGEDKSGEVPLIHGGKVGKIDLDPDLSDLHTKIPLDDMARHIAGAFGIPAAVLGISASDGAKFASNYAESREAFWADTIIPEYLSVIEDGLTEAMCPPGYRVAFDLDSIEALAGGRMKRMEQAEKITFLSEDEKRAMFGFGPRNAATDTNGTATA